MLGWLGRHYGEITDTVSALAALAIPVVVILIGQRFNQQGAEMGSEPVAESGVD